MDDIKKVWVGGGLVGFRWINFGRPSIAHDWFCLCYVLFGVVDDIKKVWIGVAWLVLIGLILAKLQSLAIGSDVLGIFCCTSSRFVSILFDCSQLDATNPIPIFDSIDIRKIPTKSPPP